MTVEDGLETEPGEIIRITRDWKGWAHSAHWFHAGAQQGVSDLEQLGERHRAKVGRIEGGTKPARKVTKVG